MTRPDSSRYAGPHSGTALGLIGYAGVDAIEDRFYLWLRKNEVTREYFTGHDVTKIKRGLRPIIIFVLTDPDSIDLERLSVHMAAVHRDVQHAVTRKPIDGDAWDVTGRLLLHSIGIEFAPFAEHDEVLQLAGKIYGLLRPAIVRG